MFVTDLEDGMILEVNYDFVGRATCYYAVMHVDGEKVGVCFKGNVNDEDYPAGWLDLEEDEFGHDPYITGLSAVYKPTHLTYTFSGDFDNLGHYQVVWKENN